MYRVFIFLIWPNQILPDIRQDIRPEPEPDSVMQNIFNILNLCLNFVTMYKYKFACTTLYITTNHYIHR